VLVHVAAAGVTPFEQTILKWVPSSKGGGVLGNQGAGFTEDGGDFALSGRSAPRFQGGRLEFPEEAHG
jgi:hypothetical protein